MIDDKFRMFYRLHFKKKDFLKASNEFVDIWCMSDVNWSEPILRMKEGMPENIMNFINDVNKYLYYE